MPLPDACLNRLRGLEKMCYDEGSGRGGSRNLRIHRVLQAMDITCKQGMLLSDLSIVAMTSVLQYCIEENDMAVARETYHAFVILNHCKMQSSTPLEHERMESTVVSKHMVLKDENFPSATVDKNKKLQAMIVNKQEEVQSMMVDKHEKMQGVMIHKHEKMESVRIDKHEEIQSVMLNKHGKTGNAQCDGWEA